MRWVPFQIKCCLSALTGGLTFYCVCSQYVILQHNAKPRNPATECVQQTMVMKYADGRKPVPQLLICCASVTIFLTWLVLVAKPHRTGVKLLKHCYCSHQYAPPPSSTLCLFTPSPTSPPPDCTPITIPHRPNSIPHWPVTRCTHIFIHA